MKLIRAVAGPVLLVTLALLVLTTIAHAQQISGSITGVVKDTQQAVIANAKVTLIDAAQGSSRTVNSGADGAFVFTPVQPGTYTIEVEATGFKKYEQKDVKVFASDRVTLGDLVMTVGSLSEVVTVEATAAMVTTQGADRAGILTSRQVLDLAMTGRNFLDLARTIPGIVYTGGLGGIQANGNRGNQNNLLLDGVTNVDTGSNGGVLATTNIDMIAEFKVTTNSQPAEFGRSSGAQIQVVTKSGTQDFHGTGYIFHRHEGLNANTWRNNIEGRPRQFYRYNYAGFNVGGPVYIPGKFNKDKNKLFFFIGWEWQNQLVPQGLRNVTVPTQLERQGNFSQSREGGGSPVRITDPQNGGAPFPNMTIPANRLSADGVKILNFYPLPNAAGTDPSFNYQSQFSDTYPRRERIFRGDWQINEKWRVYGRYIKTSSQTNKNYGQWNADYNIPFAPMNFGDPGWSFISNVTTIINPTLTNEFIFGTSKNVLNIDPVDKTFDRARLGLSYRMPFPTADPLGLIQNWRWGGVPNAPFTGFNGTPFRNFNHTYDISDNIAKIAGAHTLKFGIYLHKSLKDQTAFTSVNGNIWFDRDSSNPYDTNWAWANALTGTFQRLQQSNIVRNGQYRYWNVEWYLQDSWRASSKLTIDYGIRFYYIQPQYDKEFQTGAINPALYNPAAAAVLAQPYKDPATGATVAINPINGQILPRALTGSIINTGNGFTDGLYTNGMGRPGLNGYPIGLINGSGILYAPRVGIAYQFMPKTVLRVGAGVFYDRFQGNPVFDMLPNPPSTASPQFYYGQLASIPPASAGVYFPANVNGFDINGEIPTTYNWNATIQREMPFGVLFDIGYVGSAANHIIYRRNANAVPLGSAWLPQNQDPLNSNPQYDGSTTKAVNFYRPYSGYADANIIGFGANSNYHSLQASANRRFGKDVMFGVAYTWSRALGTTTDDYTTNHPFNMKAADYGPLFYHRTHNLVFNYNYFVPKFIKGDNMGSKFAKAVLHNWQISGITTIQSGQPDNLSFGIDGVGNLNERYTGSVNVGPRPVVNKGFSYTKTDYSWIDVGASGFALPPLKGSQGFDSAPRLVYRPGDHTWDISVFKNIPFMPQDEAKYIQLRLEMFNAFNHTRFSDFNRSMTFSRDGSRIINLPTALGGNGGRFGFGALTGTRDPRIIQLAAKIYF
jgi:hypothetical protein